MTKNSFCFPNSYSRGFLNRGWLGFKSLHHWHKAKFDFSREQHSHPYVTFSKYAAFEQKRLKHTHTKTTIRTFLGRRLDSQLQTPLQFAGQKWHTVLLGAVKLNRPQSSEDTTIKRIIFITVIKWCINIPNSSTRELQTLPSYKKKKKRGRIFPSVHMLAHLLQNISYK